MTPPADRAPVYVSRHVVQRIAERSGEQLTWRDVLALIPAADLERMARGEHVVTKVKRLALDLVCRNRAITTAMDTHRWRTTGKPVDDPEWMRTNRFRQGSNERRAKAAARTRQAHLDADEEIVVGGRVRRIGERA